MLNSHICKMQIGIEQGSECVDSDVGTHSHRNLPQSNDSLDAYKVFIIHGPKYCTFWTVVHLPFHWAIISNRFEPEPSCLSLKRHPISFTQFVKGMNTISYNICIIIDTIQTSAVQYLYNLYNIFFIITQSRDISAVFYNSWWVKNRCLHFFFLLTYTVV